MADIRLKGFGCFELVRAFGKLNKGDVKGPTHRKISPTLGRLHSCHNGGAKGPTHCKINPFALGCTNLGPLGGCSLARMQLKGHTKGPGRVKLHRNLAQRQQTYNGHVPRVERGKLQEPGKPKV